MYRQVSLDPCFKYFVPNHPPAEELNRPFQLPTGGVWLSVECGVVVVVALLLLSSAGPYDTILLQLARGSVLGYLMTGHRGAYHDVGWIRRAGLRGIGRVLP